MKILNFKLFVESVQASDTDYYDAVSTHYDDYVMGFVKYGENLARSMTGNDVNTLKTDNGNLFVRWAEGRGKFIILGAVAKSGKINRLDIEDLKDWLEIVIKKIKDGYEIWTSPNDLSDPLVQKIIKLCKRRNIDIDVDIMRHDTVVDQRQGQSWSKTYIIKKK